MKARWTLTKRCSDGSACSWAGSPAYIPDDYTVCDACLLLSVGLTTEKYDGCGDPLSMNPLYDREDVVAALRRIVG